MALSGQKIPPTVADPFSASGGAGKLALGSRAILRYVLGAIVPFSTSAMQVEATALPGVLILTPRRFGDARGWFMETFSAPRMAEAGIAVDWVQDNHSFSAAKGTLRGLHYQAPPRAQDKLVRCPRGAILDVAVDFREGSATFGRWVGVDLTAENGRQLFVPKGFLHGFVTLTDDTEVQYKCSDLYAPDCDGAVRWDDPQIGIDWGVSSPLLSEKDAKAPLLADAPRPFRMGVQQ